MLYGNWFAAFPVSAEGWYPGVCRQIPESVRLFAPEDLHLTVAFFGRLEERAIVDVKKSLQEISFSSFTITLGKLIPLPSSRRFSALSFQVDQGCRELETFMGDTSPVLYRAAGQTEDSRKPLAHVTIGRPGRKSSRDERAAVLKSVAAIDTVTTRLHLNTLALYGWDRERKIRQFQIEASFTARDSIFG